MSRFRLTPMLLLFALALFTALAGCSNSRMTSVWREPGYAEPTFQTALVVALRSNPVYRRTWEDAFVAGLLTHGVAATPSYRLFPDAVPDTQQVIAAIEANKFDAVIESARLSDLQEENYVPPTTRTEPVTIYNRWAGRYQTRWHEVTTPGYVEVAEIRRFQTDVWTTRSTGRLIWSGTVEVNESTASSELDALVRRQILPAMHTAGLIPAEAQK